MGLRMHQHDLVMSQSIVILKRTMMVFAVFKSLRSRPRTPSGSSGSSSARGVQRGRQDSRDVRRINELIENSTCNHMERFKPHIESG